MPERAKVAGIQHCSSVYGSVSLYGDGVNNGANGAELSQAVRNVQKYHGVRRDPRLSVAVGQGVNKRQFA